MGIIIFNLWNFCELKENTCKAGLSLDAQSVFVPIPFSNASSENKETAAIKW